MTKLICLLGKTGSGKTTLLKKIMKEFEILKLEEITTRPKRKGETSSDYTFVNDEEFEKYNLITKKEYNTEFGIWKYGIVDNIDYKKNINYITIINPKQIEEIKKYFKKKVSIDFLYLDIEEEKRLEYLNKRTIKEEEKEKHIKEMERRLKEEKEDFKELEKENKIIRINNENYNVILGILRYKNR